VYISHQLVVCSYRNFRSYRLPVILYYDLCSITFNNIIKYLDNICNLTDALLMSDFNYFILKYSIKYFYKCHSVHFYLQDVVFFSYEHYNKPITTLSIKKETLNHKISPSVNINLLLATKQVGTLNISDLMVYSHFLFIDSDFRF